jgi:hypothetical protein
VGLVSGLGSKKEIKDEGLASGGLRVGLVSGLGSVNEIKDDGLRVRVDEWAL